MGRRQRCAPKTGGTVRRGLEEQDQDHAARGQG